MRRAAYLDVVTGTDGSKAGILTLEAGGTRRPFNAESLASGAYQYLAMDGREVFREAVGRMADTLAQRISATDWSVLQAMGLESYDGLIIASLIEKEAKLDEERPTIASVIVNRLESGIGVALPGAAVTGDVGDVPRKEAFNALISLGYKPAEARRMLDGVPAKVATTEEVLRHVLRAAAS